MKHFTLGLCIFSLLFFHMLITDLTSNSRGAQTNFSGAPGEANCTACHNSFAVDAGEGELVIAANIPELGYTPGETYEIRVQIQQKDIERFGFEISSYGTSANESVGAMEVTDPARTQFKTVTLASRKEFITHTIDGIDSKDINAWSFNWTAPPSGTGEVTFYAASVAANRDLTNQGDYVYLAQLATNEQIINSSFEIEFEFFEANVDADGLVRLRWKTLQEVDNQQFEIERSDDGQSFATIDVIPGAGTSDQGRTYNYTDDEQPVDTVFYRLRGISSAGESITSDVLIIPVEADGSNPNPNPNPDPEPGPEPDPDPMPDPMPEMPMDDGEIMITFIPNPAETVTQINIQSKVSGIANLIVVNSHLQEMLRKEFVLKMGENVFDLDVSEWSTSLYYVSVFTLDVEGMRKVTAGETLLVAKPGL